jgi:hypothetical protein
MPMTNDDRCSFCGKGRDQVGRLIAGQKIADQRVFICNECVSLLATPGDAHVSPRDSAGTWPPLGRGKG